MQTHERTLYTVFHKLVEGVGGPLTENEADIDMYLPYSLIRRKWMIRDSVWGISRKRCMKAELLTGCFANIANTLIRIWI